MTPADPAGRDPLAAPRASSGDRAGDEARTVGDDGRAAARDAPGRIISGAEARRPRLARFRGDGAPRDAPPGRSAFPSDEKSRAAVCGSRGQRRYPRSAPRFPCSSRPRPWRCWSVKVGSPLRRTPPSAARRGDASRLGPSGTAARVAHAAGDRPRVALDWYGARRLPAGSARSPRISSRPASSSTTASSRVITRAPTIIGSAASHRVGTERPVKITTGRRAPRTWTRHRSISRPECRASG